jgi:adenosylhomocysteine nucleosidase
MKTELLIITALESELKRNSLPKGVEIVYSGVGKINAALTTAKALHHYSPKHIINFGTAGKIKSNLNGLLEIGKVIQRDMNAEPLAPRGSTPFCNRPREYLSTGQYLCGTGDSFVTAQDSWLLSQDVDIVDMELFAIAATAHSHQIPWRSFKYITDEANEDAGADWSERVHYGQQLFLEKLKQIIA